MQDNGHPHTAEYKGKKPWRFTVDSDFIRKATGLNGTRLSAPARTLYLIIQSYVGPSSPVPFPKIGTIAHWMDVGHDTLRRYMKELTDGGWLKVEQRRQGWNKFDSNAFILLDGDDAEACIGKKPNEKPCMENPRTAFPNTEDPSAAEPYAADTSTKSTHSDQEAPTRKSSKNRYAKRCTSSNSGPSGTPPAAAAEGMPSAGSDQLKEKQSASKATTFIQDFVKWGQQAGFSVSVIPREKDAVIAFFGDNPHFSPRELTAIQLNAWCMPSTEGQSKGHQLFWHCNLKSKRIKTFLEFLPAIQDELEWTGAEKRIAKAYRKAEETYLQKAAA